MPAKKLPKAGLPVRPHYKVISVTTSQTYPIVAGKKPTGSAELSARQAEAMLNAMPTATPISIAASVMELEQARDGGGDGTVYVEWNVYVLLKE